MKFCAGWFDGEIWLNQTQDGTSFGVYEISAKNNNVPTKSRMRAKTSLQALCLSVRATASDSNSMPASFNLVVAGLVRPDRMAFDTNALQLGALSFLHTAPETDNCASAVWVFSSAKASFLFCSACCCFAYPAKSIHSVRCRKYSGNSPIQQKSGRTRQNNILRDIRLQARPLRFHTKLVRKRRSHC